MGRGHERRVFHRLLDLVDEIDRRREHQHESGTPAAERESLAGEVRGLLDRFEKALAELDGDGPLRLFLGRHRLSAYHVLVVLALLRRRLFQRDPALAGRDLLALLFDDSFARLEGVRLLSPRGRLLSTGILTPELTETEEGAELLDLRYRLSDRAFRLLSRVLRPGTRPEAAALRPVRPYSSNLAYLMELRHLSQLYRKRAALLFHFDHWDDPNPSLPESVQLLHREIPRFAGHLRRCLELTPAAHRFPIVRIAVESSLKEEHLVILVTLLFQELTQGNPYLDATDLLKLVSRSEADLVRKRRLFSTRSPLIAHQLVALEEVVHDKDLTAEVYIPNSVVDRMLGSAKKAGDESIDREARARFREFLQQLQDSDDFFQRL